MEPVGIEVVVESVRVHGPTGQHVVILRELERERYLPIWIGPWEANAIAMRLQGIAPERPLTHDLFLRTLRSLGVSVERVEIRELAEETFRARIVLDGPGGVREVDARPSDAIALAIRADCPIHASERVLDRAGVIAENEEEQRLSVFRSFVNSLDLDPEERSEGPAAG